MMRGRNTLEEEVKNMDTLFRAMEKFMDKKPQASKKKKGGWCKLNVIHKKSIERMFRIK